MNGSKQHTEGSFFRAWSGFPQLCPFFYHSCSSLYLLRHCLASLQPAALTNSLKTRTCNKIKTDPQLTLYKKTAFFMLVRNKLSVSIPSETLMSTVFIENIYFQIICGFPNFPCLKCPKVYLAASINTYHRLVYSPL